VIGTAIAYLLYFRLLARVGPTNLLPVTFLLPVVILSHWASAKPKIARAAAKPVSSAMVTAMPHEKGTPIRA
jgi:hypothetical protein